MANYHVLEAAVKDHCARVVFHIAVPNENNTASINLQTAMSEYRLSPGSIVPGLDQGEIDQINLGQVYEYDEWVKYNGKLSNAQKLTKISDRYTALSTQIPNKIRAILKYWGYS
jgi:hypothetical protein